MKNDVAILKTKETIFTPTNEERSDLNDIHNNTSSQADRTWKRRSPFKGLHIVNATQ